MTKCDLCKNYCDIVLIDAETGMKLCDDCYDALDDDGYYDFDDYD